MTGIEMGELLRYVLRFMRDPAKLIREGYPSEPFSVLKNRERREYGQYRIQSLAQDTCEKLQRGALR